MQSWFVKEIKIVPKNAQKYTRMLRQCGVDSVEVLKQVRLCMYVCMYVDINCLVYKALRRESHLLTVLNFDEDDEEDILLSLTGSNLHGSHCVTSSPRAFIYLYMTYIHTYKHTYFTENLSIFNVLNVMNILKK